MDIRDISRPRGELTGALGAIATSTLANALDELDIDSRVMPSIKAVAPGFRFAGPAVTVRESLGPKGTYTSADFAVGAMIDAALPGDVIVVEGGGEAVSTWGGMASLAAALKGIAGLVVDGGVRDLEEIIAARFAVFARHMTPTTGRTRLRIEAINGPVTVDGVSLAGGDIIVADGTGIVAIPAGRAAEVLALAQGFARDDALAEDELKNGLSFSEAMAKFTKI